MKLLSIDSSGKSAACAVTENGKVICSAFTNSGLTHSQVLLPLIDKMLKDANITIEQIDEFAITCGPGSFTGLRIGMALTMGLAQDKNCYAVPTLKALAYNLIDFNGIIVPVMDARRNQVYTSLYKGENGVLTQLEQDSAISVDEVIKRLEKYKDLPIMVLGDGAYLFKDKADYISFPEQSRLYPLGESIALASADCKAEKAKDLKISYLRMSQAERELKEKNKQ